MKVTKVQTSLALVATAKLIMIVLGVLLTLFGMLAGRAEPAERPKKSGLYNAMGIALVGTSISDLASTEWALRQADVREANPLMSGGPEARIVLKTTATTLVFVGSDHLHKKGHTRTALWLRIAVVAGYGYVTAHNLRQAWQ